MATILILETDPMFAAVLEDRLHVSGHEATLVEDPALAVSIATEGRADALIMEMELPGVSGLAIVRQLREQGETRSLPVVVLSKSDRAPDRVAALRAGVDDYLAKPCDLEELLLRLDRLLGSRAGVAPPALRGDLASHPSWELVQYIQQTGKSGDLVIHGRTGSGRVRVRRGKVLQARWGRLRGEDALLALLDMKEGGFRLAAEEDGGEEPAAGALSIQEVLIRAAWIEDQLGKRRGHLPATGVPLEVTAESLPPVEEELESLPIEAVFARLRQKPGLRLYELVTEADQAPAKVRLAVAWLAEHGVLAPTDKGLESEAMTTTEITSSVVLDLAVHNLLASAREAGFDVSALPYLVLAEPGVWPELQKIPGSAPGFGSNESLRRLVQQMEQRRGGSATFRTDFGKLSLHVQVLSAAMKPQVEAIVGVCAGVLLWLDEAEEKEMIGSVVERLEAASGPASGVVVARSRTAFDTASELISGKRKWRTSTHAPQSLLGILRLLHPRSR